MASITRASTDRGLQAFIHALEQGRLVPLVRKITITVVLVALVMDYIGWKFRGFSQPEAMDQAQIARQIAHGHGWSTKFVRPLAIWQIEKNTGITPREDDLPDTYNAPLPSLINALPVLLGGDTTKFKRGELIAPAERWVVLLSMLFFLGAVGIQYLLLRLYFDARLAFWAAILTLLSDYLWEWTLSGLPQMFMLLIFHLILYALARAVGDQRAAYASAEGAAGTYRSAELGLPTTPAPTGASEVMRKVSHLAPLRWLGLAGVLFGVLALCHALTIWLLVGAMIFSGFYFRRGALAAGVLLALCALTYSPWLVRTYSVSGNPFGVAGYAIFDGIVTNTNVRMRSYEGPKTEDVALRVFRPKIQGGLITQYHRISQNLGGSLLAMMFFIALLHPFRRAEVAMLRWAVLLMWGAAVFGMAFLGNTPDTPTHGANQIGVLFLPIMLSYGLAFVLVIFARLEISSQALARLTLFSVLVIVSALPMIFRLLPEQHFPYQYPPYLEPIIALLNGWTDDKEVIASDMPWATAWYADRKSLWIPDKYRTMMSMSDNGKLSGPLAGLFISPISRSLPYNTDIYKGEMQEYAPLVLGSTNVPFFPFHEVAAPMGDLSYIFYSDTKRWEKSKPAE